MQNLETTPEEGLVGESGVLGYRIESGHYVVDVRWKDGEKTESHFPVMGFPVVNPATKKLLGKLSGEEALKILQEHAIEYERDEFSWQNFV